MKCQNNVENKLNYHTIMTRSFILIVLIVLATSCKDETLDNMNDINNQWETESTDIKAAKKNMDLIMEKYKAGSYKLAMKVEEGAEKYLVRFYNYNDKEIDTVSEQDKSDFLLALSNYTSGERNMAQLADVDEVFTIVEVQPAPKGGMATFFKYVQNELKYPKQARKMGVEGKVFVQFIVNEFGKITDVKAIKGIGAGCDEEAVRVVKDAAQWEPGKQKGQAVKVRMVLPITYKLG